VSLRIVDAPFDPEPSARRRSPKELGRLLNGEIFKPYQSWREKKQRLTVLNHSEDDRHPRKWADSLPLMTRWLKPLACCSES